MVQLTVEQRVFVVQTFFSTHSYVEVRRRFQIQFPGRRPPTDMTIYRNVKKYKEHGTSLNRNSSNSGRKRAVRDMLRRATMCIREGGRHIERLLENK